MPPDDDAVTTDGNGSDTTSPPGADATKKLGASHSDAGDFKKLYEDTITESRNWEKRFKGLQATYQHEHLQRKELEDKLSKIEPQLNDTLQTLDGLQSSTEDSKTKFVELQTNHAVTQAELDRLKLIVKDFPALMPYEAEGLLPEGTGAELVEKLTKFFEMTDKERKTARKDDLEGTTPTPPDGKEPKTTEQLLQNAQKAFAEGKIKEYDGLMDNYYAAIVKGSAS
jgi:chromosome segregation ATPase